MNGADAVKAGKKPKNDVAPRVVAPRVVAPAGKKDPQTITGGKSGKESASAGKTAGRVQVQKSGKVGGGNKGKGRRRGQTEIGPESSE